MSIAKNVLGNISDAEECVNDALLVVWNSIPPNQPDILGAYVESLNIIEHVAGYDMMVPGCEYLLFLNVAIEGSKPIYIAGNYGTVSLEEDGRYSMITELGGNVKEYKKIWDEAEEKYIK